jgi:uncharacterized Rossmann fold enzyme
MSKIEELKKLTPKERAANLEKTFEKNRRFFKQKNPSVAKALKPGGNEPFHIRITDDFLTISDQKTGELHHPEIGLDKFAAALGDWTNNAWIDLIEGRIINRANYGKYSQYSKVFQKYMLHKFPGLVPRIKNRHINLPGISEGRCFSNPVVFVGIFHGLHIDYYLSRTQLINAAFIEPDVRRFILSCYFLDYQALFQRFGDLILHIGNDFPHQHMDKFFRRSSITAPVWVRVLPGYAFEGVESLMRQFRLKWRHVYDVWVPAEWQLDALRHAMENIHTGKKIYARQAKLSSKSRIAVVGSGPSLSDDLPWLKQYQDQVIIFAAHSSVSALQSAGIKPDFQFNIEVKPWTGEHFARLNLNPDIPMVTMVGDVPDKFAHFNEVLMLPEGGGVHPVRFKRQVPFLTPTTGNTALGFACTCKPAQLFLFGLDFGFREALKTHVKESTAYTHEGAHKSQLGSNNVEVPANFDVAAVVYSQPYFNLARLWAERAIASAGENIAVYNCADGARIAGARPCRSADIRIKDYDKNADVEKIRSMFTSLSKDEHYEMYPLDGEEQLKHYQNAMIRELKMKKFTWRKFAHTIDNFRSEVEKHLPRQIARERDSRISPYFNPVNDILLAWYRLLCFTNTEAEAQQVYNAGYELFCDIVRDMHWPDDL